MRLVTNFLKGGFGMKKLLLIICVALMMTGCGGGDSKELQKIVVGLDDGFAPMGFRDAQGNVVGFDVDLAKETARRMGVAIEEQQKA